MDGIKFTPQDILQKQFKEKSIGKGYDVSDVDSFLDDVIKDYDTFNKEITRLQDENARLRSKVDELNRQVEVGSSIPTFSKLAACFKCNQYGHFETTFESGTAGFRLTAEQQRP